jgi:hypothetical protein
MSALAAVPGLACNFAMKGVGHRRVMAARKPHAAERIKVRTHKIDPPAEKPTSVQPQIAS